MHCYVFEEILFIKSGVSKKRTAYFKSCCCTNNNGMLIALKVPDVNCYARHFNVTAHFPRVLSIYFGVTQSVGFVSIRSDTEK